MAVVVLDDGSPEARHLSQQLELPLQTEPQEYYLTKIDGLWEVRDPRQGATFRLRLDLTNDLGRFQQRKINPKKDLLCRALGYKADSPLRVLDGTLGLAQDALHLLSCGIKVIGVERHPLTYFLVHQSLDKVNVTGVDFEVVMGETSKVLKDKAAQVDVLYLDPMFENIKQKSAPKKGLAFLRDIALDDSKPLQSLDEVFELGVKRVVVKRPMKSENLYGKPNVVYEGKLIRYDVYTRL